jgi:hypothetical protein
VGLECRDLVLFNSTRPLLLLDIRDGRARRIFAPTAITGAARQTDGQTLSHSLHSQAVQPLTHAQDVHEALRTAGIILVRP